VRSGNKARDTYANEAAIAHYARAIEVASRVSPELLLPTVLEIYQRRSRLQVAREELDRLLR
jgi:hypothetical protein